MNWYFRIKNRVSSLLRPDRWNSPAIVALTATAIGLVAVAAYLLGNRAEPSDTADLPTRSAPGPFRDVVPAGAFLVGFEATLGSSAPDARITSVRPIFRRGNAETRGQYHGIDGPHALEVKAPEGYAVGILNAARGDTREGFSMQMMKIVGDHLDPKDTLPVQSIGTLGIITPDSIGDGTPARAVFGRTDEAGNFLGMGVDFGLQEIADPYPWDEFPDRPYIKPGADVTGIAGGMGSLASAGETDGPVTAIEFGLVEWFGRDVIGAVHALGERNKSEGPNPEWQWSRKVRTEAKPGYALSSVRVYGRTNADGARLTFSRIKEASLDLADSYDSEPIGDVGNPKVQLLTGDGRMVHGLIAQLRHGRVVGFGFQLAKVAEGWKPPVRFRSRMQPTPAEVEAAHGAEAEGPAKWGTRTRFVGRVAEKPSKPWGVNWSGEPLLGLEVGLANRQGKEVVCGIRPFSRQLWPFEDWVPWQGRPGVRQVLAIAKPGFAVGAVRIYGESGIDGLRLTFCSKREGQLDIHDGYDSAPIGTVDEQNFVQLTGRGRLIVGMFGDNREGDLEGFGLEFAAETKPEK